MNHDASASDCRGRLRGIRIAHLVVWSVVPDPGSRFENFVASQLLKYCHFREDTGVYRMDLRFLRDTDKLEIDFVLLEDGKPLFAVECKTGEKNINPFIFFLRERTKIPEFFQVHTRSLDFEREGVRVLPVRTFCKELNLP